MKKINIYVLSAWLAICVFACKDIWEDHIRLADGISDASLLDQVQSNEQLSKFSEYLAITGYDEVLSSGMVYTVWAPANEAFEAVDKSILADTAQLKLIIANHISRGLHLKQSIDTAVQLTALNNKPLSWVPKDGIFEGTAINTSGRLCKNGVLHLINKVIVPKKNLWEVLNSATVQSKIPGNAPFLVNYSYLFFDEKNSVKIGVDSLGRNIYDSVKYRVSYFLEEIADVEDESRFFTFFLLTDKALIEQHSVYKDYFKVDATAISDSVTFLNISKDYLFEGKYKTLPDTLLNSQGVKVPVDKNEIMDSIEASNGIIYVLNTSKIALKDKVRPVLIEGESKDRMLFSTQNFNQYTVYKEVVNDSASGYKYIFVNSYHNYINNYLEYKTTLFSCKYKACWVAYYAPGATDKPNLNQIFSVVTNNVETIVATKPQTPSFTVDTLGEYTSPLFGEVLLRAKCANGVANQLSLDYIKLIPVLP